MEGGSRESGETAERGKPTRQDGCARPKEPTHMRRCKNNRMKINLDISLSIQWDKRKALARVCDLVRLTHDVLALFIAYV